MYVGIMQNSEVPASDETRKTLLGKLQVTVLGSNAAITLTRANRCPDEEGDQPLSIVRLSGMFMTASAYLQSGICKFQDLFSLLKPVPVIT